MDIISHRGYLNGPDPWLENNPVAINACISAGLKVEIDIRVVNGDIYLGHDAAKYKVSIDWLVERCNSLIVHAKDLNVCNLLISNKLHWFWHHSDDITLTSNGVVWCYPGISVPNGVVTQFEDPDTMDEYLDISQYSICTDYPLKYLKRYTSQL